eukprot:COSAG06_NODE_41913_length_386_cov_1.254355_1_plen_58_part_10
MDDTGGLLSPRALETLDSCLLDIDASQHSSCRPDSDRALPPVVAPTAFACRCLVEGTL